MPRLRHLLPILFFIGYTLPLLAQPHPSADKIKQDTLLARQLQDTASAKMIAEKYNEAMLLLDSAGVLYERALGKDSKLYAQLLLRQAQVFNIQGQMDSALAKTKAAQEILPRISGEKRDLEGLIYYNLGDYFRAQQQYDQAILYQEKAVATWLAAYGENYKNLPGTYNNLAVIYQKINKYNKALEYYEKALKLSHKKYGAESYDVALAYRNIGGIYAQIGEYDSARSNIKKALEIDIKIYGVEHPIVADVYFTMGRILYYKGDADEALTAFQKAYQIRRKVSGEDHPQVAEIYFNIASIWYDQGNENEALTFFQKSYQTVVNVFGENSVESVDALNAIGTVYLNKLDHIRGLFYLEKGMNILEQYDKEHPSLPYFYMDMGTIYSYKRDYDRAFNYYTKALEIGRRTDGEESLIVAECYTNIGAEYQDRNENVQALAYYEKALQLYFKIGEENNPAVGITYLKVGIINNLLGDPDQAIANHEKAIAIFSKNYGEDYSEIANTYNLIGASYTKKKIDNQALAYHNKALEMQLKKLSSNHPDIVNSYNYLGDFYAEAGHYEQALAEYEKALTANGFQTNHFQDVLSLGYLINTLSAAGSAYLAQYQKQPNAIFLNKARQYFIKSAEAMDTLRNTLVEGGSKQTLLQDNYAVYEQMLKIDYLLFQQTNSLPYLQEAFQYASRAKSQLLHEAMQESDALRFAGLPDTLMQREYDLRIDITYNEKRKQELLSSKGSETDSAVLVISSKLFDLKQDYEKLKKSFIEDYPDYYKLKYNQNAISAKAVQTDLLQPNQAMLEYFVGDSSIFAFVLRPDTLIMQEVKKDFPLEDWVKSLRENIYQNRTTGAVAYTEAAYNLYQKLIAPVKSLLPEQLIIIPDGILGYVPFEALLTTKPERAIRFNTHPYLLKEYQISYCYSATLLREMQQKKRVKEPTEALLAVAPFYTGDTTLLAGLFAYDGTTRKDLSPLQNSGEEVYRINKLWKGDVLTGTNATEATFTERAGNYRILHLATHGRADERVGDYSFLAFSEIKDSVENELLYVRDLYNLQLNADLVVLSACETGLGKLSRGEGIISLARAFAYAGAKSIFTTLWSVDDAKTKDLMVDFYRKLKKGLTKDAALRQAKLDYLESHANPADAHPFYWAGFAPIGDMKPVH